MSKERFKRKQFKQGNYSLLLIYLLILTLINVLISGTRGSFIKAFQVFEEGEMVALDSLEQSASVLNTLKLHSTYSSLGYLGV